MGEWIELPQTPQGTAEEQMRQMYSYLYRVAEALNHNLSEIGSMDLTDDERMVMQAITAEEDGEAAAAYDWQGKESLKSLIIKTAAFVQNKLDAYRLNLLGEYVTEGKFGKYVRNTSLKVDVTPTGIQQDFTFEEVVQGLKNYTINAKNYIKTGLLRTVGGLPVYGVAIGKDVVTFSEDGTETYNDGNKVAELTADELSFYQSGNKVASYTGSKISFYSGNTEVMYIQNGEIYVTGALKITSTGSFDVDSTNFKVDSANKLISVYDTEMNSDGVILNNGSNRVGYISRLGNGKVFGKEATGIMFIPNSPHLTIQNEHHSGGAVYYRFLDIYFNYSSGSNPIEVGASTPDDSDSYVAYFGRKMLPQYSQSESASSNNAFVGASDKPFQGGYFNNLYKNGNEVLGTGDIIDNLTSTSTTDALSAKQGKALNDGKVAKSGDTMTGNLTIQAASGASRGLTTTVKSGNNTVGSVFFGVGSDISNHGVWSNGYYDGTSYTSSGKWIINRNKSGEVSMNGFIVDELTSYNIDNIKHSRVCYLNGCSASGFTGAIYGSLYSAFNAEGTRGCQIFATVWEDAVYYRRYGGSWNSWIKLTDKVAKSGDTMTGTLKGFSTAGDTGSNETGAVLLCPGKTPRTGIFNGNGDGDGFSGTANMIFKSWWSIGFVDGCTGQGMTAGINCRNGGFKGSNFTSANYNLEDVGNHKVTMKEYSVTTTANSSVSPFSAYVEYTIPSADITAYGTPANVTVMTNSSTNPAVASFNPTKTKVFVYSKSAATMKLSFTYIKTKD